jgi:hypothetical protein
MTRTGNPIGWPLNWPTFGAELTSVEHPAWQGKAAEWRGKAGFSTAPTPHFRLKE